MTVLAAALATAAIGWVIIGRWVRAGWMAAASLGFAAGAGAVSLQLLAYSLAHIPWHPALLLLPWAVLGAWRLRGKSFVWRLPARPEALEWAALAVAAVSPALWLAYERVMPLTTRAWDAWAIWLFKAKAFAASGEVQSFLARAGEFNCQPSYPLLVPLYAGLLYRFGGDPAAKAISPLFFFALLGAFYCLARRFAPRPAAIVFTAMLANLHMVNIAAFELAGYADTALSAYLLLSAGHLYAWHQDGRPEDLALAAVFGGLAAWTKNEGLFFFGAVSALVAIRRWRSLWIVAAAAAATVLPWLALRAWYGLPGPDLWTGRLNWANFGPGLASFKAAFQLQRYNLTFWLLGASLALYRPLGLSPRWLLLPGLIAWQLAGLLAAYLAGRNELAWWIGTSLDRILAQLAPLALLGAAIAAARIRQAQPSQTRRSKPAARKRR